MRPKRIIYYKELALTIDQWMEKLHIKNVKANIIYNRIFMYKWPLDEAFIDCNLPHKKLDRSVLIQKMWEKRIDDGVEAWQDMMMAKGYFTKEYWNKIYKQLNTWYKEFQQENMKAA